MRRWFLLAVVFCAGVTLGGFGGWQVGRAQSTNSVIAEGLLVGQRPPRFSATDLSGTRHTLEQYEGSILVLHFWASWCPYCRSQIPELKTLHEEWAWKGVEVLTISIDQDLGKLRSFLQQSPLPYPVIADTETSLLLGQRYDVAGVPLTFVLGRDGQIIVRLRGRADILGAVRTALDEETEQETSPLT